MVNNIFVIFFNGLRIYWTLFLSTQQIKLAANANPLTGLPGNLMIEERLKTVVRQQEHFSALYVDLDHFKAFNDKYGFEHGDLVLLKTARILQEVVARDTRSASVFLGHIGGDDFLLLLTWDEDASVIAAKIIEKFDAEIADLYSEEDRRVGFICVSNRKGEEERFPIMSISVAIVDNTTRAFSNYLEISEAAAQLKKRAKEIEGSIWVRERRDEMLTKKQ